MTLVDLFPCVLPSLLSARLGQSDVADFFIYGTLIWEIRKKMHAWPKLPIISSMTLHESWVTLSRLLARTARTLPTLLLSWSLHENKRHDESGRLGRM